MALLTKIDPGFSIFNRAGQERLINLSLVPARHQLRLRRGGRVFVVKISKQHNFFIVNN
jgi:hypothetical protein